MTSESSNSLNFATLQQGKIYKELQKKILNGTLETNKYKIKNKNKIKNSTNSWFKEGFGENNTVIQDSQHVLSKTELTQKQILQLKDLQNIFNDILKKYQDANDAVLADTASYVSKNKNKSGNVYVTSANSSPTATYVGAFKDVAGSSTMTSLNNGQKVYNYDSCMAAAVDSGNKFFGLENVNTTTQMSQCNVGNNLSNAEKYGMATSGCSVGSDGFNYGNFNSNTTAIYNTNGSNYAGCYKNSTTSPSMIVSGPNMQSFSPVYVCGPFGIGPWGSSNFPDKTAQWIWYTKNAQLSAPANFFSSITLIYEYIYSGTTFLNATIYTMVDDYGVWFLNSRQIGTASSGWGGPGIAIPITIAPGANFIQCAVKNFQGAAGMIATVIANGQVLFNTNSNWKYTNIHPQNMVVNGQNYSVATCQKYANSNGFQYFGLQNGENGTSQCVVSNSLQTATQYGSSTPFVTLNDNKTYGVASTNALYELNQVSDISQIGKMGFIDNDLQLSEYPSSMIRPTTTSSPGNNYTSYPNYAIGGYDLTNIQNYNSLDDCFKLCNETKSCAGFSQSKTNNSCFLKNGTQTNSSNPSFNTYIKNSSSAPLPSIVGGNSSCPTKVSPIDSIQWSKYKNSGKK